MKKIKDWFSGLDKKLTKWINGIELGKKIDAWLSDLWEEKIKPRFTKDKWAEL